jgi:hypothetical protein
MTETIQTLKTAYYKPTPKKWRKWGDAILGLGTALTIVGGIVKNPIIVIVAAGLGWLGKTITNFATE